MKAETDAETNIEAEADTQTHIKRKSGKKSNGVGTRERDFFKTLPHKIQSNLDNIIRSVIIRDLPQSNLDI